jgi:hypothetical protein
VRKTFLLLDQLISHQECEDEERMKAMNKPSGEVLEKLKEISASRGCSDSNQMISEVMKLLVIPPKIDPLQWEEYLAKKRVNLARQFRRQSTSASPEQGRPSSALEPNDELDDLKMQVGISGSARPFDKMPRRFSLPESGHTKPCHTKPNSKRKRSDSLPQTTTTHRTKATLRNIEDSIPDGVPSAGGR